MCTRTTSGSRDASAPICASASPVAVGIWVRDRGATTTPSIRAPLSVGAICVGANGVGAISVGAIGVALSVLRPGEMVFGRGSAVTVTGDVLAEDAGATARSAASARGRTVPNRACASKSVPSSSELGALSTNAPEAASRVVTVPTVASCAASSPNGAADETDSKRDTARGRIAGTSVCRAPSRSRKLLMLPSRTTTPSLEEQ